MNFSDILTMRHELMLTIIALVVLIIDLNLHNRDKHLIIPITLSLFFIHTVVGFLPSQPSILFGGMYHTTALLVLMKNVLNVGVLIVLLQSVTWLKKEENREKISEYFILLFSTLIGMYFMISSGDFLMFYLGLELATIPIAALAAYNHHQTKSAEAGIKLILSSALSSGILLFGISLIYGATGSIYFDAIAKVYANSPMQILAFIFFFTGMAFKMSLVPFHLWTADVYEGAPINVTSYLSVISKGAAAFILIILMFTVFNTIAPIYNDILYLIAVLTMTIGNLFALRQKNMKRFLAFSSISQAGFILLGIMGGNIMGMTAVVYFVLVYIFSNLGAFGVVSAISTVTGKETMDDYDGLYSTNPKLSLLMMLSLFSLAGIPPVAGFFGKFFLFASAASAGYYWLVFIAVLNATISLYYYLLVVKAMFINKTDKPLAYFKSDLATRAGLVLSALGIFVLGFWSQIYEIINSLTFGVIH
ncbi:MAG TPA: NADH-quinone oxidoreductase subunit N [Prolixibacteraceae bacterium]|nr:NADH-quinone oxidoreductase subunit N [Prolixibacteraceae bacterium]